AAGDASDPVAAEALRAAAGADRLGFLRQVHGVGVVPPDAPEGRPEADAWAGRPPGGLALAVLTADCLPVLLCHPPSRAVAAVHAGWRGAVAGVAEHALKCLGAPAEEVLAALGPCSGPCCYQVGDDVARAVGRESPHLAPWPDAPDRRRLDLAGLVASRLAAAGVGRLHALGLCTACHPALFFSHRRDRAPERMASFLLWRAL
ncbi:MAG: polyphenol oxidase family protein, partial [Deferrisomatales bacterium]